RMRAGPPPNPPPNGQGAFGAEGPSGVAARRAAGSGRRGVRLTGLGTGARVAAVLNLERVEPRASPPAAVEGVVATRLRALDVLRGLAVLGMILVNNQGSGAHAFWGMAHADWNGWSPADVVFPTF